MSEERCCGGHCRRKKPPLVRQGALTGAWYVITRYTDKGNGIVEAHEKHDITADFERYLHDMGWHTGGGE